MKKVFSVLTVAVLAVSTVFAGLSGSVSTSAGYNLDNGKYGFFGAELKNAELTVKLAGEDKATEVAEDAAIYASVKASMSINATIGEDTVSKYPVEFISEADFPLPWELGLEQGITYSLKISEAKVGGQNWYVSLLGTPKAPSFAKSFTDLDQDGKADDGYKVPYFGAKGVEVGVFDYVVGLGMNGAKDKGTSLTASIATPEYTIIDGLTVKAAAAYSHRAKCDAKKAFPNFYMYPYYEYNNETGTVDVKWVYEPGDPAPADDHNVGGSVKVAYENDVISASVAADMGVKGLKAEKPEFGMDIAANFKYDFISADVYYAMKDTLHMQVNADLNSFNVPLTVGMGVTNVATDARAMNVAVGFAGYGATANFNAEFGLAKDANWKIGFDASYNVMDYATVKASVSYNKAEWLGMSISAESDKLIPGATLALGWYDATDLLDKNHNMKLDDFYEAERSGDDFKPFDFSDKLVEDHSNKGVIKASCTINF